MLQIVKTLLQRTVRLHHLLIAMFVFSVVLFVVQSKMRFRSSYATVSGSDIGVAEVIEKLRSEIGNMEAERTSEGQAAIFRVKSVDVELSFVIKADEGNKNEIHLEAVTAGVDQSTSLERSNKISLHMEIEPPNWAAVTPAHLSLDQNTRELPDVPLARSQK